MSAYILRYSISLPLCGLKESAVKIINPYDKSCSQTTDGDSKTRICGFAKGTDTCQGDSGGPLTAVDGGKDVLVGGVSYERVVQVAPQGCMPGYRTIWEGSRN